MKRTAPPRQNSVSILQTTLSVRIQPRASKNELVLMENGGMKVRLTAPPVDGAANDALVRFIAEKLELPRSQVTILSGHASRDKIIRLHGISEQDALRVLKG